MKAVLKNPFLLKEQIIEIVRVFLSILEWPKKTLATKVTIIYQKREFEVLSKIILTPIVIYKKRKNIKSI